MIKIKIQNSTYSTLIDEVDFNKVSLFSWKLLKTRWANYAYTLIDGRKVLLHRFLFNVTDDKEVDHINHDGLDNRRSNLRVCTRVQNMQNTRLRSDNSTGYKGVYYNKRENKYYAQIKPPQEERLFIGSFDTAEDAGKAYQEYADKYFGEFNLRVVV